MVDQPILPKSILDIAFDTLVGAVEVGTKGAGIVASAAAEGAVSIVNEIKSPFANFDVSGILGNIAGLNPEVSQQLSPSNEINAPAQSLGTATIHQTGYEASHDDIVAPATPKIGDVSNQMRA